MDLHFYNTLTRTKEIFVPIDESLVRLYACGPTVYDRAHIGNARPAVVFDVLFRLLRHRYGENSVSYVRNITDIDDKINEKARFENEKGDTSSLLEIIGRITDQTISWYHEDLDELNVLRPTHEPRATEFIPKMISMIQSLIDKGHAYYAEGHVLFSVESYSNYGNLARRSLDDMIAGARIERAPYKQNPMDFVMWKPSSEDLPGWSSPWGRGRPGWHIECSAMSLELLGSSFDIHAGGIDLAFPHHENELAQSMCANPNCKFANVWMHNGFLQVEGRKMAKSLGNFFTVKDLRDQGISGEIMRLVLLSTHYRQPIDWTKRKVNEFNSILTNWKNLASKVKSAANPNQGVLEALADDLNTPKAISEMHRLANSGDIEGLKASAEFLGINLDLSLDSVAPIIEKLLKIRAEARQNRDFALADDVRNKLNSLGITINDGAEGTSWCIGSSFEFDQISNLSKEFDLGIE